MSKTCIQAEYGKDYIRQRLIRKDEGLKLTKRGIERDYQGGRLSNLGMGL